MSEITAPAVDFGGLEVVAFESRRAVEMATLIERQGGVPRVAPSMREIPLEENPAAFDFAAKLFAGEFDAVLFMTGVGTRTLFEVLETRYSREKIVAALSGVTVVARGPKPIKVLREYQIPVTITVPEPNTWREVLQELDENGRRFSLKGSRIAIQEYGVSNLALLAELKQRGAAVSLVPVYRWSLPDDVGPLERAVDSLATGNPRVILFTNAAQVDHLVKVATRKGLIEKLLDALPRCVICSVGPTCSEFLRSQGIAVDLEPEHPKMGALVHEAAKRGPELLRQKFKQPATILKRDESRANSPRPEETAHSVEVMRSPKRTAGAPWTNSRFMKACRMEETDATPVWLMRQAGRYMKEYRELRARVPFLELCKNPDLVSEVTVTARGR